MRPRKAIGFVLLALPGVAMLPFYASAFGWTVLLLVFGLVLAAFILCLIGGYGLYLIREDAKIREEIAGVLDNPADTAEGRR